MLFTKTGGWIINHETGRCTWFPREHGVYVLHSWVNESPDEKWVRGGRPKVRHDLQSRSYTRNEGCQYIANRVVTLGMDSTKQSCGQKKT